MFCPECDSMLEIKTDKDELICPDCEFKQESNKAFENLVISEEIENAHTSRIEVIDNTSTTTEITAEMRDELRETYRESMSST